LISLCSSPPRQMNDFPKDILGILYSHLQLKRDCSVFALVCKKWNEVTRLEWVTKARLDKFQMTCSWSLHSERCIGVGEYMCAVCSNKICKIDRIKCRRCSQDICSSCLVIWTSICAKCCPGGCEECWRKGYSLTYCHDCDVLFCYHEREKGNHKNHERHWTEHKKDGRLRIKIVNFHR
jgi:hypothetical protein